MIISKKNSNKYRNTAENKWLGMKYARPFVFLSLRKHVGVLLAMLMFAMLCGCGATKDKTTETVQSTEENVQSSENSGRDETEEVVSLVMVGDLLIHKSVYESGVQEDGTLNYSHLFKNIESDVKAADIAVINNEVVYGGDDKGFRDYPEFNAPTAVGDAVSEAGFDVVLHASNHVLDQGTDGIENCLKFWKESHPEVAVLGIHGSDGISGSDDIFIYEKSGIKIAMLNYTYGLNGKSLPEDKSYMIDLMDENSTDKVREDIRKAKAEADAVIVFPHWGTEYSLEVDESEKEWAQLFADEGVMLVIGSHPHVIEPIEWIEGKDGNKMLCYYSVGNYISSQTQAEAMLGIMAEVKIRKNSDGKVEIADYGYEALVTHISAEPGGFTTYKLSDYTENLAEENIICRYDDRFSIEFLKELKDNTFRP